MKHLTQKISLTLEVGIYEEKKKTSVEKLADKHVLGDISLLFRLCVETYESKTHNYKLPDHHVDQNDEIIAKVVCQE